MNQIPERHETLPESLEASTLARELAAAFRGMVEYEKQQLQCTAPEALKKVEELSSPEYEQKILHSAMDQVTWYDLQYIGQRNPELAAECWQNMKRAALQELQSGHRASRVMEGYTSDPWHAATLLRHLSAWNIPWHPPTETG